MVSRSFPNSANRTKLGGASLVDTLSERFTTLFNAIALVPTVITNSGNDYTLTIDPTLEEDVISGMAFYITPNAAPTGASRIRVGSSNPYYSWTKVDGSDFESGDISINTTYLTVFIDGGFRLVTALAASVSDIFDIQRFDSSGTWTKPTATGFGGNSRVRIRAWGAGAGGMGGVSEAMGGGGGGYTERWMLLSELGATETVTIGAGGAGGSGADGGVGGNSTFGSHVTGYGGGNSDSKTGDGGSGGGPLGAVSGSTPGAPLIVTNTTGPIYLGSGSLTSTAVPGGGIDHGGGGGGASATANIRNGGSSVNGGGGGAGTDGTTAGTGGSSINGGRGGNAGINGAAGQNGTQPGGGGGGSENSTGGTGGNGRIEVFVFPVAA